MALQFQLVETPIGYGIDEANHSFLIPPVKFSYVTNGRYHKDGALDKRFGYELIDDASGQIERFFSFNGVLYSICDDGTGLYSVLDFTEANGWTAGIRWNYGTQLPSAIVTDRWRVSKDGSVSLFDPDVLILNGYRIVVWYATQQSLNPVCRAIVYEEATGAVAVSERTITDASHPGSVPKIIAISSTVALVVYNCALHVNDLNYVKLDTATLTWDAASTIILTNYTANGGGGPNWDIADIGGTTRAWALVYRHGTPLVVIKRFEFTTETHSVTIAENPLAVGIFGTNAASEEVWVGWFVSGTGTRYAARNSADLTSVVAPALLDATTSPSVRYISFQRISASQVLAAISFIETASSPATRQFINTYTITDAGAVSSVRQFMGVELASRIWIQVIAGINRYQALVRTATALSSLTVNLSTQRAYFVLNLADSAGTTRIQGTNCVLARSEAVSGRSMSNLCSTVLSGISDRYFPMSVAHRFVDGDGFRKTRALVGVDTARISYSSQKRWASAVLGRSVYLAAGVLTFVDGTLMAEVGFHAPPDDSSMALTAGGGSLSAGDYSFAIVYEYTNGAGEREFSQPVLAVNIGAANATSITVAANDRVTLRLQHCNLTRKASSDLTAFLRMITIHVYRTEANGSIYYKDTSDTVPPLNNPESNTSLTFISNQSDSALRVNEKLYTTGGALEHVAPPPCSIICTHKNRLFLVNDEDPKTIWYSKEHVEGEIPGFNEALEIQVQDENPITGLASLDDWLAIFKDTATFQVFGAGPDDKGENNDFTEPKRLSTEHGCEDWRSIAVIPQGVVRRAHGNFYLLDRQGNDNFIGAEIRDTAAIFPNTTSAVVLPDVQEVRWTVTTEEGTGGAIFVYDYRHNAWIVDYITSGSESTVENTPLRAAILHENQYYVASTSGFDNFRETGAFEDPQSHTIVTLATTAWIKPQLQGYQKIRNVQMLGELMGAHGLSVLVDYDYETTHRSTHTWTAAEIAAMQRWQPRIHVPHMKCESIRLSVFDTPDAPGTQGFKLTGFAFDVGTIPTRMRLPDAHAK
jgi:hypothetical protein